MKLFAEIVNQNPEENNNEEINEYDQPASEKDIAEFEEEIEKLIKKRRKKLDFPKQMI